MSGYYGKNWLGYVAGLERPDIDPKKIVKIGVTNAKHPMMRLGYRGADEPYPITNYFNNINIIKQITFNSEFEAKKWERRIMGMVKKKFNSPRFHNWKENDHISGITEMRVWIDREVDYILSII